jgi:hypothetical protein
MGQPLGSSLLAWIKVKSVAVDQFVQTMGTPKVQCRIGADAVRFHPIMVVSRGIYICESRRYNRCMLIGCAYPQPPIPILTQPPLRELSSSTRPRRPRCVLAARSFGNSAFIVAFSPTQVVRHRERRSTNRWKSCRGMRLRHLFLPITRSLAGHVWREGHGSFIEPTESATELLTSNTGRRSRRWVSTK